MKKWVCKQCGLYRKVQLNHVKAGQRVYFYKKKDPADRVSNRTNNELIKGVVLRKDEDLITVLTTTGISKAEVKDLYLENAPMNFVYNMFGVCEC